MDLSFFASRIKTNYESTNDEILQVKDLLSEPLHRLEILQEEIETLKTTLGERATAHRTLSDEVLQYQSLASSAIRRFPEDVLRRIFIHCIHGHSPMNHGYAPLLLTRISSGWRKIAISTPQLWSSIHICIPNSALPSFYPGTEAQQNQINFHSLGAEVLAQRVDCIRQWLDRSGELPLDISLYSNEPDDDGSGHSMAMIRSILPYSRRWQTLRLSCPLGCLRGLEELSMSDVPNFKALSIISFHNISESSLTSVSRPGWAQIAGALLQAPSLRFLFVGHCMENPLQSPIDWSQLTSIRLQNLHNVPTPPTASLVFRVLKLCTRLVTCSVDLCPPLDLSNPAAKQDLVSITLPFLRILRINGAGNDVVPYLFQFSFPALRDFEFYTGIRFGSNEESTDVADVISHLPPSLFKFQTDPRLFSKGNLVKCLQLLPHLKSLVLSPAGFTGIACGPEIYEKIDDNFLALFATPDRDGKFICPELEEFEISATKISNAVLLDYLYLKQGGRVAGVSKVSKLKSLTITLQRRQPYVKVEEEMADFVGQSLKLDISYRIVSGRVETTLEGLTASPPINWPSLN